MKRSAYLDKYRIAYFHGRVLWRLADLRSTPMLSQFGSEEDESSENVIRLNPPKFRF